MKDNRPKYTIRFPEHIRRKAKQEADTRGLSLATIIILALEVYLPKEDGDGTG